MYYDKKNGLVPNRKRPAVYSVFDNKTGEFSPLKCVELDEEKYYDAGAGCAQIVFDDNGDILIPFYFMSKADLFGGKYATSVSVMRCTFDGAEIKAKEMGNTLYVPDQRGLGEPSIIKHNNEYYMCIRHDSRGYLAKSKDGLNYVDLTELLFDDDLPVGSYSTQQHFISSKDGLYLVYTRKGADNDNVFRHRAPLFIAKVDTERMRIIRSTEQVVVPNRGARLGNFGCFKVSENKSMVVVSEWMQYGGQEKDAYKECMKYGSDNSIFITEVNFD